MFEEPVVFVDIETNGGMVGSGRITEVAAIRVEDETVVDMFTSFINPGGPVPVWITRLTGITNADLVQAPYFDEIAGSLKRIFDGAIFAAHNVQFDYSFLKHHFAQTSYDFQPKLFCTVRMSRALYPEHKGHSLEKIIGRHHIAVDDRHRAYADAKAIYDFTKLAIREKGRESFDKAAAKQFASTRPSVRQAAGMTRRRQRLQ
ncbi:MAG TPA: 3'-5' exonuclease [Candidatus Saccharimonadales bacterium]|jgi:DNA polymerase-3 subunit epsilon